MNVEKLFELIKAYKGNTEIAVEVFFKNGAKERLDALDLGSDTIKTNDGKIFPIDMVSHAEIFAQ